MQNNTKNLISKKGTRLKIYKGTASKPASFILSELFHFVVTNCFAYYSKIGHNSSMNIELLGVRDSNCILNYEKCLESLQITGLLCKKLARLGLTLLFINTFLESNETIRVVAAYSYQPILLNAPISGSITNYVIKSNMVAFIPSTNKYLFALKEAQKLNIPVLSINDSEVNVNLSTFSIVAASDDSLKNQYGIFEVVSTALIKGSFFYYLDNSHFF
jgi:ribosomal protein S2